MAVNLSKMKAIRDAFHRTPCMPDSARYLAFEKSFTYEPTEDQKTCFQVCLELSYRSYRTIQFRIKEVIFVCILSDQRLTVFHCGHENLTFTVLSLCWTHLPTRTIFQYWR
jgi:hypothetical protein